MHDFHPLDQETGETFAKKTTLFFQVANRLLEYTISVFLLSH